MTTTTITSNAGIITTSAVDRDFRLAAIDLYRDIHKGIRAELFAITSTAGSLDPADRGDRLALADHVASVGAVLESHADHEDSVIDPVLREYLPDLAEQILVDHELVEARFIRIGELARTSVDATTADQRRLAQLLHLELASFTSTYLAHIDTEERDVMPALERLIGVEAVGAMHGAIVASIPPDELTRSLAFMLPAMNTFDRLEMLTGIRRAAPAPAFEAIADLARSVLRPADFAPLAVRLGLGKIG